MLGIQIDYEFLDLAPGTSAQLERQSPFFSMDSLAGEYSLPFTFPYTPKNARLLGLQNHYYTKREKVKKSATLYDGNNFAYSGDLVIQSADLNVNDITKSRIAAYFLTGVSSFFQLVKKKKLRELKFGGIRSFAWTNSDPLSPYKGFWQHANDTLDGTFDYSFAPIINEKWNGDSEDTGNGYMNSIGQDGMLSYVSNYNTLAPQVKMSYVLECIFSEHGWALQEDIDDLQWKTLFMPSFFAVTWQKIVQTEQDPYFETVPLNNIDINLQNHVPPNMLITDFLIAILNFYNWGMDFNSAKKTVRLHALRGLSDGKKKDWTAYMTAVLASDFGEDKKVFSFRTEIDSSDGTSSAPDFKKVKYGETVVQFADLPPAGDDNLELVVYSWKENQYYQCRYIESDNIYQWEVWADGIYDYEPEGANEDISTAASTMPMYKRPFRYEETNETYYFAQFPLCEQEGNWAGKMGEFVPWGLRLLFHRGRVFEALDNNLPGVLKYPLLTSIVSTITQHEPDLQWSTVFKHEYDGVDKGIIYTWFRPTMQYLQTADRYSTTLFLPRTELMDFRWSDIILLKSIPYFVEKITETIPYNGSASIELRRLG